MHISRIRFNGSFALLLPAADGIAEKSSAKSWDARRRRGWKNRQVAASSGEREGRAKKEKRRQRYKRSFVNRRQLDPSFSFSLLFHAPLRISSLAVSFILCPPTSGSGPCTPCPLPPLARALLRIASFSLPRILFLNVEIDPRIGAWRSAIHRAG